MIHLQELHKLWSKDGPAEREHYNAGLERRRISFTGME